ncbi:hypothetical protein L1987_33050 [Smallanthus sonchifolius]|uniref:Uncharacterized protein n=1 Tax=Smallanthus sonchifolius TaxID=185202 RepID=A0ACB9HSK2_9ASTR|nr:hypothetical protein L1987_33050 [Smallanthus sonchifolius]
MVLPLVNKSKDKGVKGETIPPASGVSYMQILKGSKESVKDGQFKQKREITLYKGDVVDFPDDNCCLMGQVLMEFPDVQLVTTFWDCEELSMFFSSASKVDKQFVLKERIIWGEIWGLSLCAWTENYFKKVVNKWGEFLFRDVERDASMAIGRIGIKTGFMSPIKEKLQVLLDKKMFPIEISETSNWSPNMDTGLVVEDEADSLKQGEDDDVLGDMEDRGSLNDENLDDGGVMCNMYENEGDVEQRMKCNIGDEGHNVESETVANEMVEMVGSGRVSQSDPDSLPVPPGFNGQVFGYKEDEGLSSKGSTTSIRNDNFMRKPVSPIRNILGIARIFSSGKINGFSMIEELFKFIDIGKTLGFNMDGTENDFQEIINGMGGKFVDQ